MRGGRGGQVPGGLHREGGADEQERDTRGAQEAPSLLHDSLLLRLSRQVSCAGQAAARVHSVRARGESKELACRSINHYINT